jgi:hypothetical protein
MKELVGDKFYTTLSEKYNELLLDYVLLSWDEDYHGAESHKKAVIEAILSILNTRHRVGNNIKHPLFYVHESDMRCIECDAGAFFYEDNRGRFNKGVSETPEKMKMNYWLAFSGPPYGIPYSKEDFRKINDSLYCLERIWRYLAGMMISQIILMMVKNGGELLFGVYTING